jgi:hypothetical protein
MSFTVDIDGLQRISSSLTSASTAIDGTASRAPGTVDAGIMSAFVSELVASLTDSSAELSVGLVAAADSLNATCDSYEASDQTVAERVTITVVR